ncbi:helix-turn-helix domain-containing protein [Methylobacterium aquaticum]|uniref:Helix-turn-helix domain-containing protein n=1 Tax=Methylobacterium aquaticum TaxID=270351 RepID=A0A0J6VIZ5_9HYPH|nr:helix-turn-helix domain-containing protein [Methylobacterium aquaticum]KMO39066.1 hypothetical protein VP06_05055 [Methylobacterium aquaticum]
MRRVSNSGSGARPAQPSGNPAPADTRQQVVDAAVARVVENVTASLKSMIPEHAIRRLIELEVRAAVQAMPLQEAPLPLPDPQPSSTLASDRIAYRVEEVAEIAGVSRALVWKWIRKGGLLSRKINGVRLIRRVDLETFIDAMPASRGGPKDE